MTPGLDQDVAVVRNRHAQRRVHRNDRAGNPLPRLRHEAPASVTEPDLDDARRTDQPGRVWMDEVDDVALRVGDVERAVRRKRESARASELNAGKRCDRILRLSPLVARAIATSVGVASVRLAR
jgi:hypothetical protein